MSACWAFPLTAWIWLVTILGQRLMAGAEIWGHSHQEAKEDWNVQSPQGWWWWRKRKRCFPRKMSEELSDKGSDWGDRSCLWWLLGVCHYNCLNHSSYSGMHHDHTCKRHFYVESFESQSMMVCVLTNPTNSQSETNSLPIGTHQCCAGTRIQVLNPMVLDSSITNLTLLHLNSYLWTACWSWWNRGNIWNLLSACFRRKKFSKTSPRFNVLDRCS